MTPADLTRVPSVPRNRPVRAEPQTLAPVVSPSARYMREGRTGFLSMRRAVTRDVKWEVHDAAARAFALAFEFMRNSGWIAGASDQVITDLIGRELKLVSRATLARLGYDSVEQTTWRRQVEERWRRWSWNPAECDLEGKSTVSEMLDGAIRYYLASGEALGVFSQLNAADRAALGVSTMTKVSLASPHRLSRYTSLSEGWDQGIYHDTFGRARVYRFRRHKAGVEEDSDVAAWAGAVPQVIHVMDRGATPNSPRGISPMTPAFKAIAQSDSLADATLTTALLQTAFAATITSPEASGDAFQALQQIADLDTADADVFEGAKDLAGDLFDIWAQRIDALKSKSLSIGGDASQVNHLGPGEELTLHGVATPGPQYRPFKQDIQREIARCLGVTFSSFTMDFSDASYASVRMEGATVWPLVERRRERIAAPFAQAIYENWLDEEIGMGRIPVKGGYRAFAANRQDVVDTEWRGPARPSADPQKDANANEMRLSTLSTSLQEIAAEQGEDWQARLDQVALEVAACKAAGVEPPHGRKVGGGRGGPEGGAIEGRRTPANAD